MKENIVQKLTSKDDKYACAFTDRIVAESHDTDEWYLAFKTGVSFTNMKFSIYKQASRLTNWRLELQLSSTAPLQPSYIAEHSVCQYIFIVLR